MSAFKKYGFWGSVKIAKSVLFTKLFYPQAKIIRLPFDIRNKKNIQIGNNFVTGTCCRIEAYPLHNEKEICITIGDNVQINDFVHIGAVGKIVIGNNVLMASKVYISDHNHGSYDSSNSDFPMSDPMSRQRVMKPVIIHENVWIGESACVLPGVEIGKGSIIGALSVVTKNIPDFCIAAGNPARVIKKFNFDTNIWESVK